MMPYAHSTSHLIRVDPECLFLEVTLPPILQRSFSSARFIFVRVSCNYNTFEGSRWYSRSPHICSNFSLYDTFGSSSIWVCHICFRVYRIPAQYVPRGGRNEAERLPMQSTAADNVGIRTLSKLNLRPAMKSTLTSQRPASPTFLNPMISSNFELV